MKKTRDFLVFAPLFLFGITGTSDAEQPLTRSYLQQLLSNPSQNREQLTAGTYQGCVHIPATGFMQRRMVGFERTGEGCSVTVERTNAVRVSFLGDAVIPVVSTSTARYRTDIFIGELENGQVLIVQHHRGEVVSVTQTVYDEKGDVVYGRFGKGEHIKACNFGMTTSERRAGRKRCGK